MQARLTVGPSDSFDVRLLGTLSGHTDAVMAVGVTRDGRYAVSGSRDATLKVWDLQRGEAIQTLWGHADAVLAVAEKQDGQHAVSGSGDNTLMVWDLERGAAIRTLQGHADAVMAVALTPDGRQAVSGSKDKTLMVWDLERGEMLRTLEGHAAAVDAVAAMPDGGAVSGASDNALKFWDLERGEAIRTVAGLSDAVSALAVTPDGRRLVSGSQDTTIGVWSLVRQRGWDPELATMIIPAAGVARGPVSKVDAASEEEDEETRRVRGVVEDYKAAMELVGNGISSAEQWREVRTRMGEIRRRIRSAQSEIARADGKETLEHLGKTVDQNLEQLDAMESQLARSVDVSEFNALAKQFQSLMESVKDGIHSASELKGFREGMLDLETRTARLREHASDSQGKEATAQLMGAVSQVLAQLRTAEAQGLGKTVGTVPEVKDDRESRGQGDVRGEARRVSSLRSLLKRLKRSVRDQVDCTVFSPPEARVGESILVQVFAHVPEQAKEARKLAEEFDPETQRLGVTPLATEIARGSKLTLELIIPELIIQDSVKELTWRGRTQSAGFGVSVPDDCRPQTLIGKLLVSQDTVPIGEVTFNLKVVSDTAVADTESRPVGRGRRYRKAFISYASKDREDVLKRVQMLRAVGIRYFQDVLDLDPGVRWERELYRYIDESDVLFLFWSTAAKESEWVRREWQYGLERKGEDFIRPVIIEGPPPPEPPPDLAHLHFADKVLYFINPPGGIRN
jgi:soluble cytochrome b562